MFIIPASFLFTFQYSIPSLLYNNFQDVVCFIAKKAQKKVLVARRVFREDENVPAALKLCHYPYGHKARKLHFLEISDSDGNAMSDQILLH